MKMLLGEDREAELPPHQALLLPLYEYSTGFC